MLVNSEDFIYSLEALPILLASLIFAVYNPMRLIPTDRKARLQPEPDAPRDAEESQSRGVEGTPETTSQALAPEGEEPKDASQMSLEKPVLASGATPKKRMGFLSRLSKR